MTPNVYVSPAPYDPGNYPAILYRNVFLEGTVVASGEESGFPFENALDTLTSDFWIPDALPATLTLTLGAPQTVDCLGFVGEPNGCTFLVEYFDGAVWQTAATFTPTSGVWMGFFAGLSDVDLRVRITGATPPAIAVLYLGEALRAERRIYVGHSPITLSRVTDTTTMVAEGGQYLDRAIVRRGVKTSIAFKNCTQDWYRDEFDPFVEAARTTPFFWAWRPMDYREAAYVWTSADIAPNNAQPNGLMEVSFDVTGVAE